MTDGWASIKKNINVFGLLFMSHLLNLFTSCHSGMEESPINLATGLSLMCSNDSILSKNEKEDNCSTVNDEEATQLDHG